MLRAKGYYVSKQRDTAEAKEKVKKHTPELEDVDSDEKDEDEAKPIAKKQKKGKK